MTLSEVKFCQVMFYQSKNWIYWVRLRCWAQLWQHQEYLARFKYEGVSTPEMGVHCIAHCGIALTIARIAQSIARIARSIACSALTIAVIAVPIAVIALPIAVIVRTIAASERLVQQGFHILLRLSNFNAANKKKNHGTEEMP